MARRALTHRPRTNEPLPYVLTPGELCRLLGLGKSRFYALQARNDYDALRLDAIDGVTRYSGLLVQRYLAGEPVAKPSRFLRRATRHVSRLRAVGTLGGRQFA